MVYTSLETFARWESFIWAQRLSVDPDDESDDGDDSRDRHWWFPQLCKLSYPDDELIFYFCVSVTMCWFWIGRNFQMEGKLFFVVHKSLIETNIVCESGRIIMTIFSTKFSPLPKLDFPWQTRYQFPLCWTRFKCILSWTSFQVYDFVDSFERWIALVCVCQLESLHTGHVLCSFHVYWLAFDRTDSRYFARSLSTVWCPLVIGRCYLF